MHRIHIRLDGQTFAALCRLAQTANVGNEAMAAGLIVDGVSLTTGKDILALSQLIRDTQQLAAGKVAGVDGPDLWRVVKSLIAGTPEQMVAGTMLSGLLELALTGPIMDVPERLDAVLLETPEGDHAN